MIIRRPNQILHRHPSDRWIKKNYPKGYVLVSYDRDANDKKISYIYDFGNKEDEAWEWFYAIPDGQPFTVICENGTILSENT